MRKWIIAITLLFIISLPVSAMEFTAPAAPDVAQPYMPDSEETFAQGLWHIIKSAIFVIQPELADSAGICLSVVVIVLLLSILKNFGKEAALPIRLTGVVILSLLLLEPVGTMIRLGADTVRQMSDYCKLLLPVMTSALAAQGGTTTSAALYTGTALFNALLSTVVSRVIVPILYIYLCFSIACAALDQEILKKIRDFVKNLLTSLMKWAPRSSKFLYISREAHAGERATTSPSAAWDAASCTA